MVALGGGAVAAAGEMPNKLGDDANAQVAVVDTSGRVTAALLLPQMSSFHSFNQLHPATGPFDMTNLSTSATVALSSITIASPPGQPNYANAEVTLYQVITNSTSSCSGNAVLIGEYYIPTGQTLHVTFPSGFVLKPQTVNGTWCLSAKLFMQNNAVSGVYPPKIMVTGYTIAGTYTPK